MLGRMRVLLTGGHGFVGSHLVRHLLAEGDAVRCLSRRRTRPETLAGLEVEMVPGDVRDPDAVARAVRGVDEVYHLAALTRSRTRREMFETNVEATRSLVRAARRAGLAGRFVLCSSLAAAGPSPDGHDLREGDPCRPVTWYGESKRVAEEVVRLESDGIAWTILRPPAVYGPYDRDFLAVFKAAARGILPRLGDGGRTYHFVYAEDVAAGMLAAARHPTSVGRTYFLTHPERLPVEDFLAHVARAVGRPARLVRVPDSTLRLLASASEVVGQLQRRAPLLNRQRVLELGGTAYVCSADALRADVGWHAEVGAAEGTRRTAVWYREAGWLAPAGRRGNVPAR